jgi:CheY-like chemotaxis protein
MKSSRLVSVIALQPMLNAFSVLIASRPDLSLLASAVNLDELQKIQGENQPDVILVYLVREGGLTGGMTVYETIASIKNKWPQVRCVAILKYVMQMEKAKESGADQVLLDGVSAERLLAAIEGNLK